MPRQKLYGTSDKIVVLIISPIRRKSAHIAHLPVVRKLVQINLLLSENTIILYACRTEMSRSYNQKSKKLFLVR